MAEQKRAEGAAAAERHAAALRERLHQKQTSPMNRQLELEADVFKNEERYKDAYATVRKLRNLESPEHPRSSKRYASAEKFLKQAQKHAAKVLKTAHKAYTVSSK